MNIRRKQIRELAEDLRLRYGQLQPPVDVRYIAEEMGVIVQSAPLDQDVSGFLFRDPQAGTTIIGINSAHSRTRQRFTLAHELGHLLLHSSQDALHFDDGGYGHGFGRVRRRDVVSSTGENRDEIEANFFAAELLMPIDLLEEEIESGDIQWDLLDERLFEAAAKRVAHKFGVSSQAITIRLVRRGLIHLPL